MPCVASEAAGRARGHAKGFTGMKGRHGGAPKDMLLTVRAGEWAPKVPKGDNGSRKGTIQPLMTAIARANAPRFAGSALNCDRS